MFKLRRKRLTLISLQAAVPPGSGTTPKYYVVAKLGKIIESCKKNAGNHANKCVNRPEASPAAYPLRRHSAGTPPA